MRRVAAFLATIIVILGVSIALAQATATAMAVPATAPSFPKSLSEWISILLGIAALAAIFWRGGRVEAKQDHISTKVNEVADTLKTHIEHESKIQRELLSRVSTLEGRLEG